MALPWEDLSGHYLTANAASIRRTQCRLWQRMLVVDVIQSEMPFYLIAQWSSISAEPMCNWCADTPPPWLFLQPIWNQMEIEALDLRFTIWTRLTDLRHQSGYPGAPRVVILVLVSLSLSISISSQACSCPICMQLVWRVFELLNREPRMDDGTEARSERERESPLANFKYKQIKSMVCITTCVAKTETCPWTNRHCDIYTESLKTSSFQQRFGLENPVRIAKKILKTLLLHKQFVVVGIWLQSDPTGRVQGVVDRSGDSRTALWMSIAKT